MFLQAMGSFSIFQLVLSWVSSTIPRPKAKRAVAVALCTAVSNATNIASAYLYPSSDSPWVLPLRFRKSSIKLLTRFLPRLYRKGCIVLTVALAVCASSSMALRYWLKKENKKAARADGDSPYGFRYVL